MFIHSSLLAIATSTIFLQTTGIPTWEVYILLAGGILAVVATAAVNIQIEILRGEPDHTPLFNLGYVPPLLRIEYISPEDVNFSV